MTRPKQHAAAGITAGSPADAVSLAPSFVIGIAHCLVACPTQNSNAKRESGMPDPDTWAFIGCILCLAPAVLCFIFGNSVRIPRSPRVGP
jgi:hypothetical protein